MAVQTSYDDREKFYEGQIVNAEPSAKTNRTVKSSAFVADATLPKDLPPGRAVVPSNPATPASEDRVIACERAYQAASETPIFMGISFRTLTGQAADDGTSSVEEGEEANILKSGVIAVKVEDAVTAWSKPFIRVKKSGANVDLGAFRSDADTATAVEAANMVFLEHGAAGDLVKVEIFGQNVV